MAGAWGGYGALCFVNPRILETMTGLKMAPDMHWAFPVEAQAMYGGLQVAIGFTALACALTSGPGKKQRTVETLRTFSYLMTGIGLSRLIAMVMAGRSVVPTWRPADHMRVYAEGIGALLPEKYNANAMWYFELPFGILAHFLMRREQASGKREKSL